MKWVGPSTSMASCPSGHVTSASTDLLRSPTNAGACSPVVGGQGPVATVCHHSCHTASKQNVAPSILPALPTSLYR
jgi:hypothetical protein